MSDCPRGDELQRRHAGELAEDDAKRIDGHLLACAECAARYSAYQESERELLADLREIRAAGLADLDTPSPPTDAALGSSQLAIEGYEIVDELHRGGQGIVYRARQQHTRREVAIKVLIAGACASPTAKRRFEREIELAAQLRHPNIVTVFHSGLTPDGRQYCVMDYVRGRRLDQYVREEALALDGVLDLIATICDAVMYAHQRGIIHRDLKPSNIIIDASGTPKVLDFGLAKRLIGAVDAVTSLTGEVFGTPAYMSPEQASGKPEEIDTRSDIYSLGVILYQLLTGGFPYPIDVPIPDVIRHIRETAPTRPSGTWTRESGVARRLAGQVPPTKCPIDDDVQTIVLKALAKEPERRYQSALELAGDLRHYLAGEPIAARRTSHWYVLQKTVRRYKARFAVAAAMVLLAVGSTIALSIMYGRQARLLAQVERERNRAEHRFDQVRTLAASFMYDFHGKIADLKGALPARQLLVTTALEYLDSLASEAGDDPGLLRELASAYEYVGDLQGNPNQANLGDADGALQSYQKGLQIARELVDANPDSAVLRCSLAIGYEKTADIQRVLGMSQEALANYQQALAVAEQLARVDPNNSWYRRRLAISHDKVGDAQRDLGQIDQALASYQESLASREAQAEAFPDNADLQRDLYVSYIKVANIQRDSGQPAEALAGYLMAADIAETLVKLRPHQVRAQRDLYIVHSQIGYTQVMLGRAAEAVASHRRSVEAARELTRADPSDARAQGDLALGYNLLGEAQVAAREPAAALETFQKAREILEKLAAASREDAHVQADLASAHSQIGGILAGMGRVDEGLADCLKGHEVFEALARSHPDNARYQRDLAESFHRLANASTSPPPPRTPHRRASGCKAGTQPADG